MSMLALYIYIRIYKEWKLYTYISRECLSRDVCHSWWILAKAKIFLSQKMLELALKKFTQNLTVLFGVLQRVGRISSIRVTDIVHSLHEIMFATQSSWERKKSYKKEIIHVLNDWCDKWNWIVETFIDIWYRIKNKYSN